jgi:hypothetical protein
MMGYKDPDRQRAWQAKWIARRRAEWIAENGPCAVCGNTENLEVDHIDPAAKTMNPAMVWSLSAAKRAAELAKCQVLCSDCHLEKTLREKAKPPPQPHGTKARYSRRGGGCRCELCRAAAKQYDRERRAQQGDRVQEPTYSQACLTALATLGGTAVSGQVRKQLDREGVQLTAEQVSSVLRSLCRRMNPPIELVGKARKGKPGTWRLL